MSASDAKRNMTGAPVTRRRLLWGSVGVMASGVLGAGASFLATTPVSIVTDIVLKHLPGLKMEDHELRQFAVDFLADDHQTSRAELVGMRILAGFGNMPLFRSMLPGFVAKGIGNFERRVMNEFMMATDFFQTYALGQMKVTYYEIYSVYDAACANPIPRFSGDDEAG